MKRSEETPSAQEDARDDANARSCYSMWVGLKSQSNRPPLFFRETGQRAEPILDWLFVLLRRISQWISWSLASPRISRVTPVQIDQHLGHARICKRRPTGLLRTEFFMDSFTSETVMSSSLAISSAEGTRSCACSKKAYVLFILLIEPILLSGNLTIRDCSASACNMD